MNEDGGTDRGRDGLTVGLLGTLDVRLGGRPVDPGGPQPRAVLALLALEAGRVVAVDRLITRLWGDEPPSSALGTLQSYVSRLRRAIEPDRAPGAAPTVLVSEAPGYALRVPRSAVDVFLFEDLAAAGRAAADAGDHDHAVECFEQALALWRGPALAGLSMDDGLTPAAVRLEDDRLSVEEDRFEAQLALGRHAAAVGPLQEAVADQPLRERRWGLLALALYRSRRQADALRALSSARSTLADELGLDPGPELQRLETQILTHDPALAATPAPRSRVATPARPVTAPSLVGRDHEWAALVGALDDIGDTGPRVVLVEGEPGIGKTALLRHLADEASGRDWTVAWGRCLEEDLAPALWPWVELLRSIDTHTEATGDRSALDALVAETPSTTTLTGSPAELAHQVAALLCEVAAATPLLLVIDDLHWGDEESLELLPLVLARLGRAPVLVAAGHRPLELGASTPLSTALGAVTRQRGTVRLALEGLDAAGVAQVMADVAGEAPTEEAAEQVLRRTAGNPFFVGELVRLAGAPGAASAPVPDAVRDVVRRRLARLPEPTLAVLAPAAVLGAEVDLRVLAVAADVDADTLLDHLDPAVATRVLVPGAGGRFRFSHALVREAVLVDLSPLRLARLHQRAADALEAVIGADRDHAEPIAVHRWESLAVADPASVADALMRAGDAARRRGALTRADELFEMSCEAARRMPAGPARVQREIDALEFLLTVESQRSFLGERLDVAAERIDEVAERNDSDAARALALFTRWSVVNQGRIAEAAVFGDRVQVLARRSDLPYVHLLAAYMEGTRCMLCGDLAGAGTHLGAAMQVWRAHSPGPRPGVLLPAVDAPGVSHLTFTLLGDEAERLRIEEDIELWLTARGHPSVNVVDVMFLVAMSAAVRDDPGEAGRCAALVLDPARHFFAPVYSPGAGVLAAWARARTGHLDGAVAEAEAAAHPLRGHSAVVVVPSILSFLGHVQHLGGRPHDAATTLEQARGLALETGEIWWLPETLRLLALVRAELGASAAEVATLACEAEERAREGGSPLLVARTAATRARLAPS